VRIDQLRAKRGSKGLNRQEKKVVVSVLMPAYNEEGCLEACFYKVVEALEGYGKAFEVILEEDGSTDKTPEVMNRLAERHAYVRVLHFPARMGKGFGIRRCLEMAQGECIVLFDSDMEYPPEKIPEFVEKTNVYDIVVGCRSVWIDQKGGFTRLIRMFLSHLFGFLVGRLFAIDLQDYQSGLKAFKREVIDAIQPLRSNGFEIDSEILIKAEREGFEIGFIPVRYTFKGKSSVNLITDPIKMFLSLLEWRLRFAVGTLSSGFSLPTRSRAATVLLRSERGLLQREVEPGREAQS